MNQAAAALSASKPLGNAELAAIREMLDKNALVELIRLERFWRDTCAWDKLAACYTEDSYVCTTWFQGTGQAFARASKEIVETRGSRGKHYIWPTHIRINGDRALSESPAVIHARSTFDGIEVDMMQHCRFYSRFARTADGWRMKSFMGIYIKDTLTPVNPADRLPLDWNEVAKMRPSYRFLGYTMERRGYPVPQDLPGDDRPDIVNAFYAKAEHWFATGRDD